MLTKFFDLAVIKRKLLFKKGSTLVVTSSSGSETTLDMTELASIADVSATDIQKIDGITNGTAAANKALVLGASKEIATITTLGATNIDAGASGTAGSVDIFPATATSGKLAITCSAQSGDTTVSLVAGTMSAARVITFPDPGATANIVMSTSTLSTATSASSAQLNYTAVTTAGTIEASKAVVVDSSKDASAFRNLGCVNLDAGSSGTAGSVDIFPATQTTGKLAITCSPQSGDTTVSVVAGTMGGARVITLRDPGAAASFLTTTDATAAAVDATAAEINRVCDASARVITTTATSLGLTVTEHAERIVLINTNSTVANTFTLPVATGSGAKFTLINNIVQTQGSVVIAANGTDVIAGTCWAFDSTAAADAMSFRTSGTSDKITLNITTTGGLGGDKVEAVDIAANTWFVDVSINGSGSLATPFAQT